MSSFSDYIEIMIFLVVHKQFYKESISDLSLHQIIQT